MSTHHHPIHALGIANAEEELLAMHHFLLVMPGDPGPSLPMVVRMGAVVARLEEDARKREGRVEEAVATPSITSTQKVDERKTNQTSSAPSKIQNGCGLFMLVVETDKGTVYWATARSREHTKDEVVSLLSSLSNIEFKTISEFDFVYESDRERLMSEVLDVFNKARDGGFVSIV